MKRVLNAGAVLAGIISAVACASTQSTSSSAIGPARGTSPCPLPAGPGPCVQLTQSDPALTELAPETIDALQEAWIDEYNALKFYDAVVAEHGAAGPFSRIRWAERRHMEVLASLMDAHGVALPEQPAVKTAVPGTLAECAQSAARIETDNAAMYERMLLTVREPDVRLAFENLGTASASRHLPAFTRWYSGAGRRGGAGIRRGQGANAGGAGLCPCACAACWCARAS